MTETGADRTPASVLLLDLENCPHHLNNLPRSLEHFDRVIICYAQRGPKVPLDWLVPLAQAINSEKLTIHKMEQTGKNAADFGICFFAGMLMHELPEDAHFVIVSNDSDLDHTIGLLRSQGRSAERVGSQKADAENGDELDESVRLYAQHLLRYSRNRPARQDSLRNSVNNKFKLQPVKAGIVYEALLRAGAVRIEQGRALYDDAVISQLADSR